MTVLSYVQEGALPSLGTVTEAEGGMNIAHENQYVVLRLENAAVGQRYLVVRKTGEIEDSDRNNSGSLIQIEGEVQVQDTVNAEEKLYRALT